MRLEVLPTDRWASAVAERWRARLRARPALRLCLPTGTTPVPVYEELARHDAAALSATAVFLLDEFGGLPPGHASRCESMLRRDLLDRVPVAAFHRPDVDAADLEAECRGYDALVSDGGLDLTLLGLGMNGHLGMNEPGSPPDAPTRVVQLTQETRAGALRYGAEQPPTWGITLGLAAVLASREVWLLVRGARKAEVLRRVLHGPVDSDCPAAFLHAHPNAVVFADADAAGSVGVSTSRSRRARVDPGTDLSRN